ncbi:hypothetical protein [Eisenbergiella porci]|uniref:hypothetical protein n=1 Tax=Eisenbergiella porci TaxID=2652274 RepID=UPI002A82DC7E|nr:hypothetical protein [Eisenbergiella porci]
MELINKQAVLDILNSYGGADATDPEDKRCDDLVGYIYADVDSLEPVAICADDTEYFDSGSCGDCGHEAVADYDYCPGCEKHLRRESRTKKAVLIMKMPANCGACKLSAGDGFHLICPFVKHGVEISINKRDIKCPLREIIKGNKSAK